MRIIAGAWRGRALRAPPGGATRPTGQRMRQAIFDRLMHAPWGGRALLEDAAVLDGFAGTGAMGLEALSRGAGHAVFVECDPAALAALHANLEACGATARATVIAGDILRIRTGAAQRLVFLDPPYDRGLIPEAVAVLRAAGWIVPGSFIICEYSSQEPVVPSGETLAHRAQGVAQVIIWREA
jgi:16S rRNA (guanine966-N2)-methyltransferase